MLTGSYSQSAVIIGAGKIARGFIAHLLALSEYRITFVEKNRQLVGLLRERGRYRVRIMGAPEKDIVIEGYEALGTDEVKRIAGTIAQAAVIFVSIGGPNLPQAAPLLAAGLRACSLAGRADPLNIILCENYFQPGQWLRGMVSGQLSGSDLEWFRRHAGIVETMVLRSAIEPTDEMREEDPLSLKSQDFWELPADKEAFVGAVPAVLGLIPKANFQGGLIRKVYTYNAANATISYSGYLKGYHLLGDAANDPEIAGLACRALQESSQALCRRFGFDQDDQRQFAASALAKYQKREIVDPIERCARDPIRKLARNDRLVGPACLALEQGIRPEALSRAIAAALLYNYPGDESARNLQAMIAGDGLAEVLRRVCGIDPGGELAAMVVQAYKELNRPRLRGSGASAEVGPAGGM
jgi:mannitol-1-phosphate 5-dehydrogenase